MQNAASIAGLMITTEAMVAEIKDEDAGGAAGAADYGWHGRHGRNAWHDVII